MKAHLKDAPVPLAENVTILANCGVEVPNARFAMVWDEQAMGVHPFIPIMTKFCRKCQLYEFRHRYIYAITSGAEMEEV